MSELSPEGFAKQIRQRPALVPGHALHQHPAHLGRSERVGRIIQKAIKECGLPEGVFSLLSLEPQTPPRAAG